MFDWLLLAKAADKVGEQGGGHGNELSLEHVTKVFGFEGTFYQIDGYTVTTWGIMAVILLIAYFAGRNVQRVPRGAQNVLEFLLESLEGWLAGFMGSRHMARKYMPLLATFFLFILFSNYSGLLPGAGVLPWLKPPTSKWGTTVGLALIVFFATHFFAIKEKGLGEYLHHYVTPMPLLLPLNVLEEFIKPFSLSLRLFGNIFAEETLLAVLAFLIPLIIPVPIMALALLLGGIQAVVFTTLAAIYIGTAVSGHH